MRSEEKKKRPAKESYTTGMQIDSEEEEPSLLKKNFSLFFIVTGLLLLFPFFLSVSRGEVELQVLARILRRCILVYRVSGDSFLRLRYVSLSFVR